MMFLVSSALFSQESGQQPVNLVISVEGEAKIKRSGWSSSDSVVFGTNLFLGDLLLLNEHSKVKVVCSDLTLHELDTVEAGVPCAQSQPLLQRPDGSLINPTRDWTNDRSFPTVLSPRKTKLLSAHPVLRWTPVDGATVYKVTVRGKGLDWTTQANSITELVYPSRAPALRPGTDYKLIVETGEHSSAEPGFGLGFSVLDSANRKAVLKIESQIMNLGLSQEATEFLIAHLYSTHGLKAEAIDRLEALSLNCKEASIIGLLADLYLEVGVTRKAETLYLRSLALSKERNDMEGQIHTQLALTNIYENAIGNKASARKHLEMALILARQVGDGKTVMQAKNKFADLQP
jgi:hypothetical protein